MVSTMRIVAVASLAWMAQACLVPTETGYDTDNAAGIATIADFGPSGVTCDTAAGYTGAVTYTACDDDAEAYTLGGCAVAATDCLRPANAATGYVMPASFTDGNLAKSAFVSPTGITCDTGYEETSSGTPPTAVVCDTADTDITFIGCSVTAADATADATPAPPTAGLADATAACKDEAVNVANIVLGSCAYHINWAMQTGITDDPGFYSNTPGLLANSSAADFQCALYSAENATGHANLEETHHCIRPCTSTFTSCAAPEITTATTEIAPPESSSSSMPTWAWLLLSALLVAGVVAGMYFLILNKPEPKKAKRALHPATMKAPLKPVQTMVYHQTQAMPMAYAQYAQPQTFIAAPVEAHHMSVMAPIHASPVATYAAPSSFIAAPY